MWCDSRGRTAGTTDGPAATGLASWNDPRSSSSISSLFLRLDSPGTEYGSRRAAKSSPARARSVGGLCLVLRGESSLTGLDMSSAPPLAAGAPRLLGSAGDTDSACALAECGPGLAGVELGG